jgi:serine protease Do
VKIGEQPDDVVAAARGGRPGRAEPANGSGASLESLGVRLVNPSPELLRRFRLEEGTKGAVVTQVEPRSDAFTAGLRQGDVITRVNGTDVANVEEAQEAIKTGDAKKGIRLYVTNADGSRFVLVKSR